MSQTGLSATTGRHLSDLDHIRQSVRDILLTPVGTRLMRRDYGSLVPALLDQPANPVTLLRCSSAAVTALTRWEPRLRILRVLFSAPSPGSIEAEIQAQRLDLPTPAAATDPLRLTIPIQGLA